MQAVFVGCAAAAFGGPQKMAAPFAGTAALCLKADV
jgi:hypothetical protein